MVNLAPFANEEDADLSGERFGIVARADVDGRKAALVGAAQYGVELELRGRGGVFGCAGELD